MPNKVHNVLPDVEPLTEDDFHAAFMIALSRLIRKHGKGKVAEWLGVSVKMLGNYALGSLPAPHRLFNLVCRDTDALDPIDREYGVRRVPRDAICSSDPIAARMASLLSKCIEIEHEGSDGGSDATLRELLGLPDAELRFVANRLNGWVARIDAHNNGAPKAVAA